MLIRKIVVDNQETEFDRWEDIAKLLTSQDGREITEVILQVTESHFLGISGGNDGHYYLCGTLNGEEFFDLTNPTGSHTATFSLVMGGQRAPVDAYRCVGIEITLKAAAYFTEHGAFAPELAWTKQ